MLQLTNFTCSAKALSLTVGEFRLRAFEGHSLDIQEVGDVGNFLIQLYLGPAALKHARIKKSALHLSL
jgi:hypothetical protein